MNRKLPAIGVDWDLAIHWHKKMIDAYYYDQKVSINGAEPVDLKGYSVDRHTDFAIDYIEQRAGSDQVMVRTNIDHHCYARRRRFDPRDHAWLHTQTLSSLDLATHVVKL